MSEALSKLRSVEAATKARNEARAAKPTAPAVGGAGAPAPAAAAAPRRAKHFALVSAEQYAKNLKLLRFLVKHSIDKVPRKDREAAELMDRVFLIQSQPERTQQAFLNGLADIYNKAIKNKFHDEPPHQLDWLDWFNASKTGQHSGWDIMKYEAVRPNMLGKYFNIYTTDRGEDGESKKGYYGFFYGFA